MSGSTPPSPRAPTSSAPNTSPTNPTPSGPKYPAPKDKTCPFCHQQFTSSSLGRHLDLFIRQVNPKAPDGKHDVDQIRQMRGRITRRQPKTRDGADIASTVGSAVDTMGTSPITARPVGPLAPPLLMPTATPGTLNPPTGPGFVGTANVSFTSPRSALPPPVIAPTSHPATVVAIDRGRAAELALRDLCDTISAVKSAPHPFGFDPFALTFPALCIHVLPPPPTLFATTVMPTSSSWPIDPPDLPQRNAVLDIVKERMAQHRGGGSTASPDLTTAINLHINRSFDLYLGLSEDERRRVWTVEMMRALAGSQALASSLTSQGLAHTVLNNSGRNVNGFSGLGTGNSPGVAELGGIGTLSSEALIGRWMGSRDPSINLSGRMPSDPSHRTPTVGPLNPGLGLSMAGSDPRSAAVGMSGISFHHAPSPAQTASDDSRRRGRKRGRDAPSTGGGLADTGATSFDQSGRSVVGPVITTTTTAASLPGSLSTTVSTPGATSVSGLGPAANLQQANPAANSLAPAPSRPPKRGRPTPPSPSDPKTASTTGDVGTGSAGTPVSVTVSTSAPIAHMATLASLAAGSHTPTAPLASMGSVSGGIGVATMSGPSTRLGSPSREDA